MDALEHIEKYQREDRAIDGDREYEMVKSLCRELRAAREAVVNFLYEPMTRLYADGHNDALRMVDEKMKEVREAVEAAKSG